MKNRSLFLLIISVMLINNSFSQNVEIDQNFLKSTNIFEGTVVGIETLKLDDKNYISYKIIVHKNLKVESKLPIGDTVELISSLPESWGVLGNGEFYKRIQYSPKPKSEQTGLAIDMNSHGVFFAEPNNSLTNPESNLKVSLIPSQPYSDSYFNIISNSVYNDSLKKRETLFIVKGFNRSFDSLESFNNYLIQNNLSSLFVEKSTKKKDAAFLEKEKKNKKLYESRLSNSKELEEKLKLKIKSINKQKALENISFEIQNQQVTGTGTQYLEFDIIGYGSSSNTYLDNCAFVIEFNTFAFGVNLAANNLVTITKGSNFNNPTYYDPMDFVTDDAPNAIRFGLGLDYNASSWNRTQLTIAPQTLLHLKFDLSDCNGFTDLTFTDITNVSIVDTYTTNPTEDAIFGTFFSYDSPDYIQPNNFALCPPPTITTFSPISISSGTNTVLTINGYGFGNTRGLGQIQFAEANDGGSTYIPYLNGIDYISWSDTEIKINLPFVVDSIDQYYPGSGIFKIVRDDNQIATSPFPIDIKYAAYNIGISPGTPSFRKVPVRLVDNSSFFDGYAREFYLDTSITNNPAMSAIVYKSLHDWSCATTINWNVKDTIIQQGLNLDGKSIIYLDDSFLGDPLARTQPDGGDICIDATTNEEFVYFKEVDIAISRGFNGSTNWFFDTTMTLDLPLNNHDFYSTVLHELGHAHYLGHVNNSSDLMYYGEDAGPTSASNRYHLYTSYNAIDGGIFISSESQGINVLNCSGIATISPLILNFCGDLSLESLSIKPNQIVLYPNPFIYGIYINFNNTTVQSMSYQVTDISGKIVASSSHKDISTQHIEQIDLDYISEGIYIVTLNINNIQQTFRIIKN